MSVAAMRLIKEVVVLTGGRGRLLTRGGVVALLLLASGMFGRRGRSRKRRSDS